MKRFRDIRESYLRIQERGRTYNIVFNWRGKMYDINMFFPKFSRPSKAEVAFEVRKAYPNAIILYLLHKQYKFSVLYFLAVFLVILVVIFVLAWFGIPYA